jgi:AraC-like DNA-binding protein
MDLGRLERARQTVRKHLRSPALGPMTLCHLLGISRSHLYRLFEDVGGVARYIQSRRLHEAHAILSHAATTKPISLIAEELCFPDTSGFSRAFKREFGYRPSEARFAARADWRIPLCHGPMWPWRSPPSAISFADFRATSG